MSARFNARSLRTVGAWGALLTGAGLGLAHAFPVEDVRAAGKCPPAGEGLNYCILQKAWMPAAMEVLLLAAAGFFLYELLLKLPYVWRAACAERARRKAASAPPWETDSALLAASWGNKYDDPAHPKPRRVVEGPIAVPARPVAVPSPQATAPEAGTAPRPTPGPQPATRPQPAIAPQPAPDDAERRRRLARIALALDLADKLGLEPKPAGRGISASRRAA